MPGAGAGWAAAAGGWEAEKLRGPRRPWTWLAEGGGGSEGEYPRWRCPPSLPVGAKSAGGERERSYAAVPGGGRRRWEGGFRRRPIFAGRAVPGFLALVLCLMSYNLSRDLLSAYRVPVSVLSVDSNNYTIC